MMSKYQKTYIAAMAVVFAVGVILIVILNSKPYTYPSGPVIDKEYVRALSWNYVKSEGFNLAYLMAAEPVTLLLITVVWRVNGVYIGKRQKALYILLPLGLVIGMLLMAPNLIRVGLGRPSAAVEVVRGKKESVDSKGGTKYYLTFQGGKVNVPNNWYYNYNVGDKLVVVRSGGVPLEVQQEGIVTISEELS